MTVSEEAQKTHEELFPGHVSTLRQTDPELIEYFDNFAFDEVLRHGNLDTKTRLMVQRLEAAGCPDRRDDLGQTVPVPHAGPEHAARHGATTTWLWGHAEHD